MKVHFVAGALGLWLMGCGGSVNMVRPSKPHATLIVKVQHGETTDGLFEDVVFVDGEQYGVGDGTGGQRTFLVAPGKHDVRLVSLRQEQRLQVYDVATATTDVFLWGGISAAVPVTRVEPSMQLGPSAVASCKHVVEVDVRAGQTSQAGLLFDGSGACHLEGI